MASSEFFDKIRVLTRLLTHKVQNTLPETTSSVGSLNSLIRQAMKDIEIHLSYMGGTKEFEETFTNLKDIVHEWGSEGGTSKYDRAELAVVMEELLGMLGVKRGDQEKS